MTGMITLSVSEVTILPNAAPMITATARSSTLPRLMKALNSENMLVPPPAKGPCFAKENRMVNVRYSLNRVCGVLDWQYRPDYTGNGNKGNGSMKFTAVRRAGLVVLAALGLASCGINSIPTKEEAVKARWADVEATFQERANLVPN